MEATSPVDAAKVHIKRIIGFLRQTGDRDDALCADGLQSSLDSMDGWFATKEELFRIGEMCHPRSLGDRYVQGFTHNEWIEQISHLRELCAAAFNELERSDP